LIKDITESFMRNCTVTYQTGVGKRVRDEVVGQIVDEDSDSGSQLIM
jgi:hypothetical protein